MAEAGLRKLLDKKNIDDITVYSSGTAAASGYPATAYAIEAVRIWEADLTRHTSTPLTARLIEETDMILCMTPSHCEEVLRIQPEAGTKTFLLKKYPKPGCRGEGIDDPIGGSLEMYNRTFIEIGEELGRILDDILEKASRKKDLKP